MDDDNDLTMESTTDTPEQIAEGLDVTLETADAADAEAPETPAEELALDSAVEGDEPGAEVVTEEAVADVAPEPAKAVAPVRRPRTKALDGAAAAARRTEAARRLVAETERDAALLRIRELTAGKPLREAHQAPPRHAQPAAVVKPEDVPGNHPALADIAARRTALGAKPLQGDFDDFMEFEAKRDDWVAETGALRAEERLARQGVATQATIAAERANRDAEAARTAFTGRIDEARARHADYDTVMDAADDNDMRVLEHVKAEIMASEIGGELAYYLAKNPAAVDRLNALDARAVIREVTRLEDRIKATMPAKPGRQVRPVTRAPRPQEHSIDGDPGGVRQIDLNDPNLPFAEYKAERARMDRASGRSTH